MRSRPSGPFERVAANGFTWTLSLPQRPSAAMGARKPLATIALADGEVLHVPVPVAHMLVSDDAKVPESRAELMWQVRETAEKVAWSRVVDMVSRREYSSEEARSRLVRDGFSTSCAERVVTRAQELRIINDARFAEAFVRSKLSQGWGPVRIERELSRRGVEAADVEGWPDAFLEETGEGDVLERARAAVAKRRVPEKNPYPKLVRYLVSRGYPVGIATSVAKERIDSADGM